MVTRNNKTDGKSAHIVFPDWVKGPTPCKTQTMSRVIARGEYTETRHGAVRILLPTNTRRIYVAFAPASGKMYPSVSAAFEVCRHNGCTEMRRTIHEH